MGVGKWDNITACFDFTTNTNITKTTDATADTNATVTTSIPPAETGQENATTTTATATATATNNYNISTAAGIITILWLLSRL
jgi:hypothetical protein